MKLTMLIIGICGTLASAYSMVRREAIVVRLRARAGAGAGAGHLQPPIAYAVVGVILCLAGVVLILATTT